MGSNGFGSSEMRGWSAPKVYNDILYTPEILQERFLNSTVTMKEKNRDMKDKNVTWVICRGSIKTSVALVPPIMYP